MTALPRLSLTSWCSLLALVLLACPLAAQPNAAVPKKRLPILGYGTKVENAKDDALKKAAHKLAALVHEGHPSLANWKPSSPYVEKNCVEEWGQPEEVELIPGLPDKGIKMTLTLKPPDLDALTSLARLEQRLQRSDLRLRWGLWILPLLVIGLAILAGYCHLEHRTGGRYRLWARSAAMTTAAAAWTAWWWAKDFFWTKV